MDARWFLSQFYQDGVVQVTTPVCAAYGAKWMCPTHPADPTNGWALVQMLSDPHQIEAAREDPRVIVCPLVFDPAPLDPRIIAAYESWGATPGMTLAGLLSHLHEAEPSFGASLMY